MLPRRALLLCFIAVAHAAFVAPPTRLPCVRSATPRAAPAVSMVVPPPPLVDAAASLPSTLLLSDAVDAISSFATNPLILLVPISAGGIVASIIIYILVKSAG